MIDQDITKHDAQRLAAVARRKAALWLMMAEDLELTYGLSEERSLPASARTRFELSLDDIRRVLDNGVSKRKSQIADALRVSISDIEPLLTSDNGIDVNQQGWVSIITAWSAEHQESEGGQP